MLHNAIQRMPPPLQTQAFITLVTCSHQLVYSTSRATHDTGATTPPDCASEGTAPQAPRQQLMKLLQGRVCYSRQLALDCAASAMAQRSTARRASALPP